MYVLFDLDDTLVQTSFYLTEPRLKLAIDRAFSLGFKGKGFLELYHLNKVSTSAKEALQTFFEPIKKNQKFYDQAVDIVYNEIASEEVIEPFDGVKNILNALHKKHTLGLVTYGNESLQYKKLEKAGIESSLFSTIVVTNNKDKEPSYRTIFEKEMLDPKQFIVVGDRFDRDLKPAKKLGFQTVLVAWGRSQKKDWKRPDFVIKNFNQLSDIIK